MFRSNRNLDAYPSIAAKARQTASVLKAQENRLGKAWIEKDAPIVTEGYASPSLGTLAGFLPVLLIGRS